MEVLSRAGLRWAEAGLSWAFPRARWVGRPPVPIEDPFCEQCGEPFFGEVHSVFECSNCAGRRWALIWARAAFQARGPVRAAIHGFKYKKEFYHLSALTGWLEIGYHRFASNLPWDALVPVPLHHLRERERGFNQSKELARALSERVKTPVLDCLQRYRETSKQAGLFRADRLRNLRQAFRVNSRFDVRGLRLLLIDDVFTTGTTANSCARILRRAGAETVGALTVARG